ncbi:hypothetical protein CR513_00792, partial [Mucuna pruriens]
MDNGGKSWFANRRVDSVRKERFRSELPSGSGNQGPCVPSEHETPIVLLHLIAIPTGIQLEQHASLLEGV